MSTTSRRRPSQRQGGQALVEFALTLPLLLVFLFTIVEFGIALEQSLSFNHAAKEGARAAALGASQSDIIQKVKDSGGCDPGPRCTITPNWVDSTGDGDAGDVGDSVEVRITNDYEYLTPLRDFFAYFGATLPSITLGGCAEMRQEVEAAGVTAESSICD